MENPVVLNYHNTILRRSDVEILQGPHWFSDTLIAFYFEYLENAKYKRCPELLFVSPQVTQCLKVMPASEMRLFVEPLGFSGRKFAFFALNDNDNAEASGGSHWSLLVFSVADRVAYHVDSCRGSNSPQAKVLAGKLASYLGHRVADEAVLLEPHVLQQTNNYDCGVHVLSHADRLADIATRSGKVGDFDTVDRSVVQNKRREVLELVLELRRMKS